MKRQFFFDECFSKLAFHLPLHLFEVAFNPIKLLLGEQKLGLFCLERNCFEQTT